MRAPLWHLAWRSLANRSLTVALTVLAVAISVAMLLGVERLRQDAREGFARTVSGTDLIVGARSGPVQLLLYSIFHLGDATNNVSWRSLQSIAAHPQVAWLVPLSLGDTHRGFRVVGTSRAFFEHYRHGRGRTLAFEQGRAFDGVFEAVVGAEVAARHGYVPGQRIVVSHGAGGLGSAEHDDRPFTITGVLARSGTPVDRSVLVSLEAIEAIHLNWSGGVRMPGLDLPAERIERFDLTPPAVTAALVGLKSRTAVFSVQRHVNDFRDEPLLAILPGATLQQLWSMLAIAERALLAVSALVVVAGLAALVAVMVAGLNERRRELAILRALGAGPGRIFVLLALESQFIAVLGCATGLALVHTGILVGAPWLEARFGLELQAGWPGSSEWRMLAFVLLAAAVASLVPGWRAWRQSLAEGMTIRI